MQDIAHIIQWDREGAVVIEPIAYNHDPSLVEFLSLYLQASPELHGIDIMIKRMEYQSLGGVTEK